MLALQPAAEVIAADQRPGGLVADLVFVQAEQRLRRRVGQLDLAPFMSIENTGSGIDSSSAARGARVRKA